MGNFIKDVGRFRFRGYLGERIEGAHTLFVPIPENHENTICSNSVKDIVMQFNFRIAQVESEEWRVKSEEFELPFIAKGDYQL